MSRTPQKELVTGAVWHPAGAEIPDVDEKLYALSNQCTDCNICEVACSLVHSPDGMVNPLLARLKVDHSPQVGRKAVHPFGFAADICHHCGNPPPCAEVCPADAFYYDPKTNVAVIAQHKCIQCMECVRGWPLLVIFVAPDGELLKCDLCGGEPACVDACATRPEMNNAGKQYVRAPVLFHTDTAGYRAVLQDKPERKDEVGMMQAMLEAGTVSSAA
jgi:Fe-S-cluster-containing dehydrogenase component